MRVLINAASANMGGAVTYLQNILRWLPRAAPELELDVCVPKATRPVLEGLELSPRVRLVTYSHRSTSGLGRVLFDQVQIPRRIRATRVDVLFSCTGFGTFVSPCPQVLLIRNPVYFDPLFHASYRRLGRSLRRNTIRRWMSIASARTSDVVLFPTEAMRHAVEKFVSLEHKEAAAIHYGFDHQAFPDSNGRQTAVPDWVDDFKRDRGFILLNVSTYAVHKNYETVVEALPLLKERGMRVRLLTTLSREKTSDKAEYDALKSRVAELGLQEDFVELGYVPYRDLGALYQRADAYVFPSFTESFGHTMVEAMALGLPVVAAGTDVNREVCGSAGRYFEVMDASSCAQVLEEVLTDAELRADMRRLSAERAQHFSWERYAEELVEVFRTAAGTDGAASRSAAHSTRMLEADA